jgi:hypothetical protein
MFRCPTCVSLLVDPTVRRCPVCGENFKRHPPQVLGASRRVTDQLTSFDIRANAEASKLYGQASDLATVPEPDLDLPQEHLRDSSGRTAGADRG